MVQMDGSFHRWLEERGPEGCLIDMVDDATNTTWAQLGEQETIWAVADALRAWIERYGVPLANAPRGRIGPDFPIGEPAHDLQRLGGAVRQPVFPTRAAEPPPCRPSHTSTWPCAGA
jgi:hypothetical protein